MKKFINHQAKRRYHILAKLEAGIALSGAETKSVKTRGIQLQEAVVQIKDGEAFLVNAVIAPYPYARNEDYDPRRPRKLLLKKSQLAWLISKRKEKLTIVPLSCYTNQRGWIKVEIALAKAKKKVDRRREIKEREIKREIKKWG